MSDHHKTALEKLKAQQLKITARIQQMEARHKVSERKKDLRRKILIGAYYLDQAKQNLELSHTLKMQMKDYLTRESDRQLFDLDTIPEEK